MGKKDLNIACLYAPRYRGRINPGIGPKCFEQYYQIAGMDCGTTWEAGMRIGKKVGIAAKWGRFDERGRKLWFVIKTVFDCQRIQRLW